MVIRLLRSVLLALAVAVTAVPAGAVAVAMSVAAATEAGDVPSPGEPSEFSESPQVPDPSPESTPSPDPPESATPEPVSSPEPDPGSPTPDDPAPAGSEATAGGVGTSLPAGDPIGRVDAVGSAPGVVRASGWAIDPDTAGPIIVQMYVDGWQYSMAWADLSRPDVAVVFPDYGPGHGFSLSLGVAPGAHTVCVYAVNQGAGASVSLGCSQVTVPSSDPIGRVDAVGSAPGVVRASGWAIDPDTAGPIIVQMYVDGWQYSMAWADLSRPDVAVVFPGYGPNHGFSLSLGVAPGAHTVCVYAVNQGAGASVSLGCSQVTVPSSDPIGRVESLALESGVVTASGWAIDPDTAGPIIVQMYVDGSQYSMAWADLSRPDVAVVFPGHGPNHGFTLSMAVAEGLHRVCLYAVNTGAGASTVLGCGIVGAEPLPACYYGDVPTRHQAYEDWYRTLLDTIHLLPSTYAPGDLVDTGTAGLNGGYRVRSLVVNDLRAMAQAASAAGAPFVVTSAYRSYSTQMTTFNYWVSRLGYSAALLSAARPGHSEHQLGTTLDFTSTSGVEPWDYTDWGTSPAGSWLRENAWRYGFVMSYPAAVSPSVTCYTYEPWHFRYVGRQTAAAVRASGLTLREYLWTTWGG